MFTKVKTITKPIKFKQFADDAFANLYWKEGKKKLGKKIDTESLRTFKEINLFHSFPV